ncbi:MAG: HD domain-containing protein [Treponema sp.]|nr:HD domain-containing protein [Treponema sp.]
MIGAWEFSEYLLVVSIILLSVIMVRFAYHVFFCRDVLLKNEGVRFLTSVLVFAGLIALLWLNIRACRTENLSLWLGFPLFVGSIMAFLLLSWAFGQLKISERRAMTVLETIVGVIEAGDPNLEGHSLHVRNLTLLLYDNLPLAQRLSINVRNLEYASLLLDVGKLGVPRNIINKTGKLEPEEWDLIRRHPELAVKILQPITAFDTISNWIKYHHERVDGTGYYHLRNEQIPLASRLMAVADSYSAMTMERSYRATMTHELAISELRHAAGTQLDAEIVDIFCHIPCKKIEASMDEVKRMMRRYEDGDFRVRTKETR